MGNRPDGLTSPNRMSLIAWPPACPGYQAATTTGTRPSQGMGHRITGLEDDHGMRVGRRHRVDERILSLRQIEIRDVAAFHLMADDEHDGDVGVGGQSRGARRQRTAS